MNSCIDKSTRFLRHYVLALFAICGLVACGGGGGSGAQPTTTAPPTTQAGIVVTTITDATVPVIAVVADQNWKERIILVGNKDAVGTPINLTEVHYSSRGIDNNIELSVDGFPSIMSDQAGNKIVFTNWTSSTVDVTFFDQEGGTNAGPTTIQMDPAKLGALKNTYATILQGQAVGL